MEYLPHPVWKAQLREGMADPEFAAKVGRALKAIHEATRGCEKVAARFPTDAIFHTIRIEPYLLATAAKHPDLATALKAIAERTAGTHECLVHGDISPKNILAGPQGPVFLDAECAWYGDPAFDLAFCLNHLLLKCLWVPKATPRFLACFDALVTTYAPDAALEQRAAALQRAHGPSGPTVPRLRG